MDTKVEKRVEKKKQLKETKKSNWPPLPSSAPAAKDNLRNSKAYEIFELTQKNTTEAEATSEAPTTSQKTPEQTKPVIQSFYEQALKPMVTNMKHQLMHLKQTETSLEDSLRQVRDTQRVIKMIIGAMQSNPTTSGMVAPSGDVPSSASSIQESLYNDPVTQTTGTTAFRMRCN
uniref:Uncharacterized protein n=1 Tax=viral metagenome TaxID=1070528 RepID=A0A6C0BNC4_9ZZZZ